MCKRIVDHAETVADAFIFAIDHQGGHRQAHGGVLVEVDNQVDVILYVALVNQTCGAHIVELIRTDLIIAKLVDLISLENVAALQAVEHFVGGVVLRYARIELGVFLAVVVGNRVVVGQVEDQFIVQLLNGDVRRIRSRDDFEAIVKERLGLVVGNAHQLH